MEFPLITIGITAFNAVETIDIAIESALKQTWKNTEIIIVDDCSGDDTLHVVKSIAQSDMRISIFQNPENTGVAATRNRILELARGEFVVFF